jgi:hypothetical protein
MALARKIAAEIPETKFCSILDHHAVLLARLSQRTTQSSLVLHEVSCFRSRARSQHSGMVADFGKRKTLAAAHFVNVASTQSMAYDLTAGEIDLNNSDKNKSSGVLYPAAQLIINKQGQLQFELRKNPWKLVNITF